MEGREGEGSVWLKGEGSGVCEGGGGEGSVWRRGERMEASVCV